MRKTLLLLLAFLPLVLLGQELKCCESKEEVEDHLSGKWKMKNTDSNTVFKYWFEKGQGHWTEMVPAEKKGEYMITDFLFKYWINDDQGYTLKIDYAQGHWTGELKSLNSNKMLLVSNGKETEYIKESQ